MSELKLEVKSANEDMGEQVESAGAGQKPVWETPRMEDVSNEVMAQPYIRFT